MGSAATLTTVGLTAEFLEKSLNSKITSYTVNPGSSAGDNFTSVVHAISVQLQKKKENGYKDSGPQEGRTLHLMLKSYPSHPARRSFLDDTHMFQKELLIYKILMPELARFVKDQVPDFEDELKLAVPPFFDGNATEAGSGENQESGFDLTRNFILMEDVRSWGFKMADKVKGLDIHHCKLVFAELAKLHALNWAYKTKHSLSTMQQKFPFMKDDVMCVEQTPLLSSIIGQNFQLIKTLLEEEFGSESEQYKGFVRFETDAVQTWLHFMEYELEDDKIANLFRIKPKGQTDKGQSWACGSHGDMWVNNILFRYNPNDSPVETIFVDLQLYREASPLVDLAYFIYSSTNSTVRKNHLNELLHLYFDTFVAKCQVLDVDPFPGFTLEELKRRFHLAKAFGLITATFLLPIILVKPTEATDLDTVSVESTKFDEMFKEVGKVNVAGSELKEIISEIVRELYDDGLI